MIQKAIREAIQGVQRIPESIEDLSFKRKENRVEAPKPVQQTLEWRLKDTRCGNTACRNAFLY